MQQAWWTGPIAARGTGDIGMLVGFGASVLVYAGTRAVERHGRARGGKAKGVGATRMRRLFARVRGGKESNEGEKFGTSER